MENEVMSRRGIDARQGQAGTSPGAADALRMDAWRFARPRFIGGFVVALVCVGAAYIAHQFAATRAVVDPWFIGLQQGAVVMLLLGMRAFYRRVPDMLLPALTHHHRDSPGEIPTRLRSFYALVFHEPRMLLSGLAYGSALAAAPWVLRVWPSDIMARAILSGFLTLTGWVSGVGLYALVAFFFFCFRFGSGLKVGIWSRADPSVTFVAAASQHATILASVYIAVCIGSIGFSVFQLGTATIAYSVFCAVILLSTYMVPQMAIHRKLVLERTRALDRVNTHIEGLLDTIDSADSTHRVQLLQELDLLLGLRAKTEQLSVWPSATRPIVTVVSVVIVTLLPKLMERVLQILLER